MNPGSGKRIRLNRMFRPDSGASLMVAFAHGPLLGPVAGMRSLSEIQSVAGQLKAADVVMTTPGLVPHCEELFSDRDSPSMMLLLDWQNISRPETTHLGYQSGAVELMASVAQAAALGADAVMTYLYLGFDDPKQESLEISRNTQVVRECENLGLVHMIESRAVRNEKLPNGEFDPVILKLHTRIAGEIGADLIKTKYSGNRDTFREVADSALAPILVAGGPMTDSLDESLALASDAMASGAVGLVFGRNIYQRPDPAGALEQFRAVVQGNRPS